MAFCIYLHQTGIEHQNRLEGRLETGQTYLNYHSGITLYRLGGCVKL